MTAHIRLAASEGEELIDEAPVGLPEEASSDKGRLNATRRDEMLGEAAFHTAWEEGRRLPWEQAAARAVDATDRAPTPWPTC